MLNQDYVLMGVILLKNPTITYVVVCLPSLPLVCSISSWGSWDGFATRETIQRFYAVVMIINLKNVTSLSQMSSMSEFWVQYDDESTSSDMQKISQALNMTPLIAHTDKVEREDIFAAPLNDAIYRAKVLKLLPRGMVQVRENYPYSRIILKS